MTCVLVTGTSAGIGEQIALYLLKQSGVKVIGVARRGAPESLANNENYRHIQGDITKRSTITEIKEVVGPKLDGAVFNAGILDAIQKVANVDIDAFKRVFEINFFSVLELTQAVLPALRAAHGRGIYVSSGASTHPYQAWSAYGSSKAALNLLVATLAVEEPDITFVSVAPGVVDTPMQTSIREKFLPSGEMSKEDTIKFGSLKKENNLVKPEDSGALYGRLALSAKPEWSGKYYRYSDPEIN